MNEYGFIKLIHLGALIFWLGPPLGAWLVFKAVKDDSYQADSIAAQVSRIFYLTILLEHIAFITLLVTGFLMAFKYHLIATPWLTQKLYIVILILIPLEIVDIWLGNWVASRASQKLYAGHALKTWEQRCLDIYHGAFTKIALLVIPISVLLIMYLATSKTPIKFHF